MAKINREFLVPYLQDVCALYMADLKVCAQIFGLQKEIIQRKRGEAIDPPEEPVYEKTFSFLGALGIVLMCSPLLMLYYFSIPERERGTAPIGVYIGIFSFFFLFGLFLYAVAGEPVRGAKKRNQELARQYEEAYQQYQIEERRITQQNEEARKEIPNLENQMNYFSSERKKITRTIEKVYAANIIPKRYRDVYAAMYLYDFFSTSRSSNLDMALNTYVLEQIKDKLDEMIEQQREAIINQRMIMVNQQRALEEQRAYQAYMKKKARQIASSLEEQNQYLDMIESNAAATAYFAAADYLR